MNFGIREKTITLIAALLCGVLLWYGTLYFPQKRTLEKLQKGIEAIRMQQHALASGTIHTTTEPATEENNLVKEYNEIIALLPRKATIRSILTPIRGIVGQKAIDILSIKPLTYQLFRYESPDEENELQEIPVEIKLRGRFIDVGDYLFDLSHVPFFGGFNKITIEMSDASYPQIEAEITCILLLLQSSSEVYG
ncbi:MAG: type 4a pilus biogenesis protein PilO [bacterium]